MTEKKKTSYAKRALIPGLLLFELGFAGGFGYDIYQHYNPPPIIRRYNELRNDKEVKIYNELRCKSLEDLEESPELIENFQSVLNDPEVKEYKQVSVKRQELRNELPNTAFGFLGGILVFFSSASVGIWTEERKKKLENQNE